MKKSSLLALSALVLGSAAFSSCNGNGGRSEEISKIDLVAVKTSKEKWGFLDPKGNVLFEDEFKSMPTVVYNGFFSIETNDKIDVYKVDGNKYNEVGDLTGLKSAGYYEDGLIPVCFPKERISVYDEKGNKKFEVGPVNGKEVISTATGFSDGLLRFNTEEDKEGYMDKAGKVVIKPSYDTAKDFADGLAVVSVKNEDTGDSRYSVIDKKGETVFKFKEGQYPRDYNNGYFIVSDGDRDVLYNTKGEITKFPSKISSIFMTDGKYVIFKSDDGNDMGVADMEGEIIIRAKYSTILFNGDSADDGFVAWDDDESIILNAKGEQQAKLAYKNAFPFGKFGYFGEDGNRYNQIDKDGKPICKDDFENINFFSAAQSYSVKSDFFDTAGIATTIAGLINGDKVGDYKFGASPSSILPEGSSPSDYTWRNQVSLDKLESKGFRYSISANGEFTRNLADYDWDYYTGSRYYWNSDSKLGLVNIAINAESEWGKAGYDALISAFKTKGFTVAKEGYMGAGNAAMLTKGDMAVLIIATPDSNSGNVMVMDKKIDDVAEAYSSLLRNITADKNGSPAYEEVEAAAEAVAEEWAEATPEEVVVAEEAW